MLHIFKSWFGKGLALAMSIFFGAVATTSAAYTGSVDYVAGVGNIGDTQYSSFIDLLNSPIGYLLGFVLGLKLLKWMGFEIKGMTPSKWAK